MWLRVLKPPYGRSTMPKTSARPSCGWVNLADDADTTGAVCGQLAGAYWGESGIPVDWREGLARRDVTQRALAGLIEGNS